MLRYFRLTRSLLLLLAPLCFAPVAGAEDLSVLFLGDNGPHRPHDRFKQLDPVLTRRGVKLTYTDRVDDLNAANLRRYDALLLYANIDRIEPEQADALLKYVAGGGGFVPLHCASYCFRNSPEVVALMGAQFQRHGVGEFSTQPAAADHPIMRGYGGFESWDETYVHHLHNEKNRTVLEHRVDKDGREPWTWVRTHGDGRVFYTAWGHDARTWGNPGFRNLVERGIRWAAKDDPAKAGEYAPPESFPVPEMTPLRKDAAPFDYVDVGAEIPNYRPSAKWGVQGKPLSKMQKPLSPDASLGHMVVPRGFHVELYAAEGDLGGKPIAMAWDERGRLWVAETYDYPNELQPSGKGRDRIRICEDTNGDGRADKFTVFAENLSIPTSIAFHRGGAIVQNGVETLYLKDTNGDGAADERRVLFTRWSLGDTHGGVSNFQYGLDNWVWAMQGYNESQPVGAGEASQKFRMGFFRFRPDGSQVEFIRSTNNNTWGLGISEEGLIFGSTANRCPSVFMPIANRYYEQVRGWAPSLTLDSIADTHRFKPITDRVRQVDQHGGYTAGAGHALYTARAYPREYWNRVAFVNGPTGHLVGAFVLTGDGAGFKSTSPFNLLASDDEWTAPIMSEVGPDGQVWVLDWYNYIVQHNPTPQGFETGKGRAYVTKLRDKKHGRIYRVVYDGAPVAKPVNLAKATPAELVEALAHPTMLVRKHAQRLLVERGRTDVVPMLLAQVADQAADAIGLNAAAIHALWTLEGLGVLDGTNRAATAAVVAALRHPSAGVRRNAAQVLPANAAAVEGLLASGVLCDPDPHVRLAAVLALADLPPTEASGAAVLSVLAELANLGDPWLRDAATCAAANNSSGFLRAAAAIAEPSDSVSEVAGLIANHFARGEDVSDVGKLIASLKQADPRLVDAVLVGLRTGWREAAQVEMTPEFEKDLGVLLARLPLGGRGVLIQLATSWGSTELNKQAELVAASLLKTLADETQADGQRIKTARQLIAFQPGDEKIVSRLLSEITPRTPPAVAQGFIAALEQSRAPSAGRQVVGRLRSMTPAVRRAAVLLLLKRSEFTKALLDAAADGKFSLAELALDQKQALANHPDRSIRAAAKKLLDQGGSLPNADRQQVLDSLASVVKETGDPAQGKQVFKKHCAKCHTHSGEGAKVGPDLTGMAVHPKLELLTHVIDPSRNVEGNFRAYTVLTEDGRVFSGMLASESKTALELFDAEGKKHAILRDDIDEIVGSRKSIMPEGFEKQASRRDFADLLEFLTQRGQFLPVDLSKIATIASDRSMFVSERNTAERLIFSDWSPKTFRDVPFQLTDPREGSRPNVILLHGPAGVISRGMPRSVAIPCNGPARAIHLLSGVSGWGHPFGQPRTVSMIVRLRYADGSTEDHELLNGVHFADYIRRVDVPGSEHAFMLRGRQIRYLAIHPKRADPITQIEFVKGPDDSAPVVMAATIESPSPAKDE